MTVRPLSSRAPGIRRALGARARGRRLRRGGGDGRGASGDRRAARRHHVLGSCRRLRLQGAAAQTTTWRCSSARRTSSRSTAWPCIPRALWPVPWPARIDRPPRRLSARPSRSSVAHPRTPASIPSRCSCRFLAVSSRASHRSAADGAPDRHTIERLPGARRRPCVAAGVARRQHRLVALLRRDDGRELDGEVCASIRPSIPSS